MLKNWLSQKTFQRQLKRFQQSTLADYYTPPNVGEMTFDEADFLVLDFETTGLSVKKDRVLSVGYTTLSKQRIQLGKSAHFYIRHTEMIPDETVIIHHITEQEAAQGLPIQEVFPTLLQQLSGKILVAHFADIEVGFLQQIARLVYQTTLPLVVVDTLQIAFRRKYKQAVYIPPNALNLFTLRESYQLPRYKAHNAMSDAVATAELLMAQVQEMRQHEKTPVKKLLTQ